MNSPRSAKTEGRRKTLLVFADQILVSGVNFILGFALARFLGPQGYGEYVLANGVILFLAGFHTALIVSPMMVSGPALTQREGKRYYRSVLTLLFWGCLLLSALLIGGGHLAHYLPLGLQLHHLVWPLIAATIGFLCQDYARRYFFASDQPASAMTNDAVSYGLRLALIIGLATMAHLDAASGLWVIATASFLGFAVAIVKIRQSDSQLLASVGDTSRTARDHWHFGRWLIATNMAYWVSSQLVIYLVAAVLSISSAGAMVAALNIVAAANILFLGLENLAPPRAARIHASQGIRGLNRYLRRITIFGAVATAAIVLAGGLWSEFWLNLLYGGAYQGYGWIVWWWGVYYLIGLAQRPLLFGLRVLNDTRSIFFANLGGAMAIVLIAYPAMQAMGLKGAMVSLALSQIINLAVLSFCYARAHTKRNGQDRFPPDSAGLSAPP
jgi:O-antigen/teichoic acid export membrane protein